MRYVGIGFLALALGFLGKPAPVDAAQMQMPLRVTSGSIGVTLMSNYAEPGGTFGGPGWEAWGWSWMSCCLYGPESETFAFFVAELTVRGVNYVYTVGPNGSYDHNALISITVDRSIPEGDCNWITGTCDPYSAPFTMTGSIAEYELVGQGTYTHGFYEGYYYYSDGKTEPYFAYYQLYDFGPWHTHHSQRHVASVPEPSTLLLASVGLIALAVIWRGRFRRRNETEYS